MNTTQKSGFVPTSSPCGKGKAEDSTDTKVKMETKASGVGMGQPLEPGMERCPAGLVTMQGNIFVRLTCDESANAAGCKMLLKEVKLLHEKLSFLIKARAQYPNYGHGLTDQAVISLIEGDGTIVYTISDDSEVEIVDPPPSASKGKAEIIDLDAPPTPSRRVTKEMENLAVGGRNIKYSRATSVEVSAARPSRMYRASDLDLPAPTERRSVRSSKSSEVAEEDTNIDSSHSDEERLSSGYAR